MEEPGGDLDAVEELTKHIVALDAYFDELLNGVIEVAGGDLLHDMDAPPGLYASTASLSSDAPAYDNRCGRGR